jgi:hypothetical protein
MSIPSSPIEPRPFSGEALSLVAIGLIGAGVLTLSWRRWIEPVIDLGRDVYIPVAMTSGLGLYSEVLYYYPPTAPAILAAIVAVFGSTLGVYTGIGIVTAVAAGAGLYWVVRTTSGWPAAAAILLAFVSLHLAGTSTWGANFIFPYAHAATFGMTFFLLHAAALAQHLFRTRSAASGWVAAIFGVISASTKIEYIPAVGLVVLTAAAFYRFSWRYVLAMGAGGAGLFGLIAFVLRGAPEGRHWLRDNVFASQLLQSETAQSFYSRVSGIAWLGERAGSMLSGILLLAATTGLLVLAERAARGGRRFIAGVMIAGSLLAIWLLADEGFFRTWPVLLVVLVPFAIRARGSTPLAFLLALSFGTAWRVFFSLGPWWYGFVLSLPSWAVVAYAGARWLPERGAYRRSFALVWLALVLLLAGRGIADSAPRWRVKSWEVSTARGTFYAHPPTGAAISALLDWLGRRPVDESLAVLPEGLAINWFAARNTPLAYHTFTPIEIDDPVMERRIVNELESKPPDLVVLVSRNVGDFGYRGLGIDYGHEIVAVLRRDYVPVWQWPNPEFPIIAAERRQAPDSETEGR